jgi:outer membrane protein assembly factor BamA
MYYLKSSGSGKYTRPSNIWFSAVVTQEKQFQFETKPDLYWSNEKYHLFGTVGFKLYPNKYYGIGNSTTKDMEENYTSRSLEIKLDFLRQIRPELNIGLRYALDWYTITEYDPDGELIKGEVSGSQGGMSSGLGLVFNWDNRDNIFFPSKGSFHQLTPVYAARFLGSDFEYFSFTLDSRKFIALHPSHILAFQAYAEIKTGSPSFRRLALLGGEERMRGYFRGRYRDNNMIVLQMEYRVLPVWWRIGLVGFFSVGDVSDKLGHFNLNSFKYTGGFGIRYIWNREDKLNIRIDFAWGQGASGFYITLKEAF